ncbi:choline dehydrogenase-like flavoprotein [Bradyrhizobium sp. R2.2-H]|jgi:choline dehydrogenase-like flavoprotein|uniref:FAD-dependent oxidoreductase n=1 Tax=unclassified Bradyrhizobium TaxID=2631580 RepID=UPI0010534925|nr:MULTISPECIES: FAD-dependent oxidoreductase [unclassified Bradyrhizobium]TCU76698.1 choline dehydrogenase-like flavoprotein [Bradyrhizobium sp. Y-H1]TCU79771.1 choline dehydrogenase-like flavoprotein [Bradyrhizobium sp. R2.2-H]
MLISFADVGELGPCDVCVVGGGPVGIALALACEERGLSVVLVESGHEGSDEFAASLSTAHLVDEQRHAPTQVAICRGLGGTSRWWGGRCVPFDQVDFAIRPHVPGVVWPITHREISSWYEAAAAFFGIGPARFTTSPVSTSLGDVRTDQLERWTAENDAGRRNRARLAQSSLIRVVLGATVTEFKVSDDGRRVVELTACNANQRRRITAHSTVLACGGLETTRLLLVAQQNRPGLLGSALGRFYMGHASGKIADVVFTDPDTASAHDFFLDEGLYVRRRFTLAADVQQREKLLNIAFWLDNPPFHNAAHRNGILSLVWMALAIPPIGRRLLPEAIRAIHVGPAPHRWSDHLLNVLRSPFATLQDLATIVQERFLAKPRRPGFLIRSAEGRYALHFLAEQAPNGNSRVSLSDRKDVLGLPFLDVDIRFSEVDAQSVVRAHEILDQSLRESGYGRLDYHVPAEARIASVLRQAKDGFHQIGTTRMGMSAEDSVVDADCRIHGIENLYVASSSVFVSSSHANPTFSAVALALRLAAHLSENARAGYLGAAA